MGKKRRNPNSHETADQYGEVGKSQDRDEAFIGARGSFRGGGSAGITRGVRGNITYERKLPKFLQPYAHLVEEKRRPMEPVMDDGDFAEDDTQEAFNRALEENPALEKELNQSVVNKAKASAEKDTGNSLYSKGDYQSAIKSFSKCIELDSLNEVYYSNRSAAYSALKDYEKALKDAESVIRMKPKWVKGWARLAVAHFGLHQYSHAKEAYNQALELEPDDQRLVEGRNQAEAQERQQIKESKHTFHKTRKKAKKSVKATTQIQSKAVKLSYEDDEEEEES
eukprot:g2138.t1